MARKKSILSLAKELDFSTESEYFQYCIDSYINGNKTQCKELFSRMAIDGQKQLLRFLLDDAQQKEIYNFYFNLL